MQKQETNKVVFDFLSEKLLFSNEDLIYIRSIPNVKECKRKYFRN